MKRKAFRRFYRKLREPFEWALIRLGRAVIPGLSMAGALRLSRFVADTAYLFDSKGKAISRANLRMMFPGLSRLRERILVRGAYRNMARVLIMIFWMGRDTRERIRKWVSFSPRVWDALTRHRPCITVSAHLGNWEILSQACVAAGLPMVSVAKRLRSEKATRRLTRIRASIGQEIVQAEGALRALIRALRLGKYIGLVADQHLDVKKGGAWTDFFGLPVGISMAPAALSARFNLPILFAWSRPLKNGAYRIEPGAFFPPGDGTDTRGLTRQMANAFEKVIRRHPSLWCLNYRQWRRIRNGAPDPARYPFYARPERTGKKL